MDSDSAPNTVEQDFLRSWDLVEQDFIGCLSYTRFRDLKPMVALIADLRARHYDRHLRAGRQLFVFVLSRSHTHGLRGGQAKLSIWLRQGGGMNVEYYEPGKAKIKMEFDWLELNPELENLLLNLLNQPID